MFVFIQMSHDYGDEFYVDCAFVMPKPHWEADLEKIKKGFEDGTLNNSEYYFGTNEFLLFNSFEDFEGGLTVKECSEAFYDEFKILTGGPIGFNVIEQMLDR